MTELTLKNIKTWVESKDPDEIVATCMNPRHCVVAAFATEVMGLEQASVVPYRTQAGYLYCYEKGEWAAYIERVKATGGDEEYHYHAGVEEPPRISIDLPKNVNDFANAFDHSKGSVPLHRTAAEILPLFDQFDLE